MVNFVNNYLTCFIWWLHLESNQAYRGMSSTLSSDYAAINGGAEETRTLDLFLARETLSQLSYSPI